MNKTYVHGCDAEESGRPDDQARTFEELLHQDKRYPTNSQVLEAGCGTGVQTAIPVRRSPGARVTAMDIAAPSLTEAKQRLDRLSPGRVHFAQADCAGLPYANSSFDHVLEFLAGAPCPSGNRAPGTQAGAQAGRQSYGHRGRSRIILRLTPNACGPPGRPLPDRSPGPCRRRSPDRAASLSAAHADPFDQVQVSPRVVYADPGRPEWEQGFSRNTFIAIVAGVAQDAIAAGMIKAAAWRQGISDLEATIGRGTFHCTFFRAVGHKAGP